MTGMRGNPCERLWQSIHVIDGEYYYSCGNPDPCCEDNRESKPPCPIDVWCPIVGDKKYHIVKEE